MPFPLTSRFVIEPKPLQRFLLMSLVLGSLGIMGILTKMVLIPSLRDPGAAYYSSSKGYPAKQRAAGKPIEVEVVTLASEEFESSLAAPGEVVAQEKVELRPTVEGVVQEVYFEEGTWVEAGDLLLRLDPGKLENDIEIAQLNLATARANLLAVEHSRLTRLEQLQNRIDISQLQFAEAEEQLHQVTALVTDQQSIDLEALQTQLDNAQAHLESVQLLVDEGALSQIELQQAQNDFAKVQQEFLRTQRGSVATQKVISDAQNTVVRHRQQMQYDQQALIRVTEFEDIRLEKALLTVENRTTLLNEALRAFDQTMIYATTSGLLSSVNVDEGELIQPNNTEAAMVLDQNLVFQAYVDQTRLNDVQVGDAALVRLMAYAGQTFEGEVLRVNPAIETEDFIPGRVGIDRQYTYSVWIGVPDVELSPGLQGYVHLSKPEVGVLIPESAVVHLSAGEGMVMVVEDDRAVVRSLKLGPLKDNQRQVIDGLSPGDQVILYPNGLQPGDTIQMLDVTS